MLKSTLAHSHLFTLCLFFALAGIHFNVNGKGSVNTKHPAIFDLSETSKTTENFKILVYDETSDFTHTSRDAARVMFRELGEIHGFDVEYDRNGDAFNSLENLQRFTVVVFSNTSGNEILNNTQKSNFESYIQGGGSFLGIHAATDTYRTGWNWYRDLVGGSVRTDPHHTAQNFPGVMDVLDADHPATANVPDPWSRNEEWYYWKGGGGYLYSGNINLLRVRATGDNDYDEARPISWYKEYDGGRSFYTAMGHDKSAYEEEHFRNHITGAISWLAETTSTPTEPDPPSFDPIENPEPLTVNSGSQSLTLTGISAGSGNMANVSISATSDNPELIPDPEINYESPATTATLSFQPIAQQTGTAEITVTIDNGEESDNTFSRSFSVTVVDEDQTLTVSDIEDQAVNMDEEIEPLIFNIFFEGEEEISFSIVSDNEELIPTGNIDVEGSDTEKVITITPVSGMTGEANITIIVEAGGKEVERHFKVEVFNITSIGENELKSVNLYPNPAEKEISITIQEKIDRISIYDITGKKLQEIKYSQSINSPYQISLRGLESGTYILIIHKENTEMIKKKLIIKH